MKHLIICREYPPASSGGIGTYVLHMSRLLAENGETVHIIGQLWKGAETKVEEKCHGRLVVHRVPFEDWTSFPNQKISPAIKSQETRSLFESGFSPQCFSWQACLLAERLVEQEGIDLVEAQEYEAPLYYFQLRRALGFGPKRQPPCLIHLHSPSEFIAQYNDANICLPAVQTAKRLEDYSIAAADALLCPSRYLAKQVETHWGLKVDTVCVIPYPMGNYPTLERDENTWKHGTICYVGRLERRKGVIEWIDAAVSVAHKYPNVYFEFIGANVLWNEYMRGEEFVKRRIPNEFRTRFSFRGQQKRSSLPKFLSQARIAVVPSRWDNFPNTCVEAMCSGIPVIVSPNGGMVEMIEDNRTGWIAANASSDGLAETLRRALETPPTKIAEMGRDASSYIRQMCENKKIVEKHLHFRNHIIHQEPVRSLNLPLNLSCAKIPLPEKLKRRMTQNGSKEGIAIVITCFNTGQFLDKCLLSLEQQTKEPAAVVIVDYGSTERQTLKALIKAQHEGWQVIREIKKGLVPAKNAGIKAILDSGINPIGFAFLSAKNFLQPRFVAVCESVLQRCTEVGLVSCWVSYSKSNAKIWIKPCPVFPYQWLSNDVAPFGVIRTEALLEAGNFRSVMNQGYEDWYFFNAIMAIGWVAVTVPEILVVCLGRNDSLQHITSIHAYGQMRRELMERFPDMITRDAKDIALLTMTNFACSQNNKTASLQNLLSMAQKIARHLKIKFHVLRIFKCLILFLV